MKRDYKSPLMKVERFNPNVSVAGCNKEVTGTTTSYEAQTVNCIVNGSETIFGAGTSGCTEAVSVTGSGTKWYFTEATITNSYVTAGDLYFVWYTGTSSGKPNNQQQAALANLGIDGHGWHAAPVTASMMEIYGFSY